jgi:hypothetical protein
MGKPLNSWRKGKLDMAAWKNDAGQISFTFRKVYKDKQSGEFKETKYLWPSDIADLAALTAEVAGWWQAREQHNDNHMASGGYNDSMATSAADTDDIPF